MKTNDMNELVQAIAREVVRQLKGAESKPCALILAERDCLLAEKVRGCLGDEYNFYFLNEDMQGQTPCRHILPLLPCASMASLATGGACDAATSCILKLLLQGTKVEVLEFEYEAYADTMPGALFNTYQSHAEKLAAYGLTAFKAEKPHTVMFRETLVTEAVINKMAGSSVLMVPGNALVTPAAVEAAKAIDLNIQKES
ncbi:hypothetical protein [Pseudodesulfovibrio sp. zrk46]|uniref:hypothetical protein n=1 Tax=Pseudodesulfovibrio sp. zrk46 TaxID=2725288 RepID=UPI001449D0B9|nr:hypothetical protein [Pseudodesulfovibrio sp. zrk46]QJB57068.1 hypothetical protein HFN16_11945 [Pseudodesulfovibrio sp. zrk46]